MSTIEGSGGSVASTFSTSDLDAFANAVTRAQRTLVKTVAGSGVFAAAGGLIAGAKFSSEYREWISVIATITGVAGMLSVYLGSLTSAPEERSAILRYRPVFAGVGALIWLGLSTGAFWFFYREASVANPRCGLLLAIGTFTIMRGFGSAVLTVATLERQREIWGAMSSDDRLDWLERQNQLRKAVDDAHQLVEESRQNRRMFAAEQRRLRWAVRSTLVKGWFSRSVWLRTRNLRKRIGLYTANDRFRDFEVGQELKRRGEELHRKNLQDIEAGLANASPIEGTNLIVYRIGGWIYCPLTEDLNAEGARVLIESLRRAFPDAETLQNVVLAVPQTVTLTTQAQGELTLQGIAVFHVTR